MRILHIGWGFQPWRGGGLIEYAEDLMNVQKYKGHDVYYFFSGRHFPFYTAPRLCRWRKNNIQMFEIINPPVIFCGDKGTLQPELDLNEPVTEKLFRQSLKIIDPEIIHIHELAGLPSSLIEIAKEEFSKPVVMTLADYFLLCPTLKLLNVNSENCMEESVGNLCIKCCSGAPQNKLMLRVHGLTYRIERMRFYDNLKHAYRSLNNSIKSVASKNLNHIYKTEKQTIDDLQCKIESFENRRIENLRRLKKIDVLVPRSQRVEQIYRNFLGDHKNIKVVQPTVKHLERIRPIKFEGIRYPIKFATLNGCISVPKGARLILDTLKSLHSKGLGKSFEFHIFGGLLKDIKAELLSYDNVSYHGYYHIQQLDEILSGIHVGIIPSIWEEVFGYVGLEFLAKGIPLIGNKRGGITEYTRDGVTGFVNQSASAFELAEIMEKMIINPKIIKDLNKKILSDIRNIIKTVDQHSAELMDLYNQLL